MLFKKLISFLLLVSFVKLAKSQLCPVFDDGIVYVDSSIAASGDGRTWGTALKELSEGVAVAHECPGVSKIYVARGTYKPFDFPFTMRPDRTGMPITTTSTGTPGNRDKTFHIRQGLKLYGGYGSGGTPRDTDLNRTILNGALNNADSVYHLVLIDTSVYWNVPGDSTVIDGFILVNGRASTSVSFGYVAVNGTNIYRAHGAGIQVSNAIVSIVNNKFYNNVAVNGAALCSYGSDITFKNNQIENNSGLWGGGVFATGGKSLVVSNGFKNNKADIGGGMYSSNTVFTFMNNELDSNYAAVYGGGVAALGSGTKTLLYNVINNNRSLQKGGGVFTNSFTATFNSNFLYNNTCDGGGGGACFSTSSFVTLTNNVFYRNYSNLNGGGVYFDDCNSVSVNNTFFQNAALSDGGGIEARPFSTNYTTKILNNIFWQNKRFGMDSSAGADIHISQAAREVAYNLVQRNSGYTSGEGTISNQYPGFKDTLSSTIAGNDGIFATEDDGLQLSDTSICLNRGSNNAVPPAAYSDIVKNPRILNSIVEMGAYEIKKSTASGKNIWIGHINNEWEMPGNWSLGVVPDSTMEVEINQGTCILNSNGACYNIFIHSGAVFTIAQGFTLTVVK